MVISSELIFIENCPLGLDKSPTKIAVSTFGCFAIAQQWATWTQLFTKILQNVTEILEQSSSKITILENNKKLSNQHFENTNFGPGSSYLLKPYTD
mgnify:CR=1 FL=1